MFMSRVEELKKVRPSGYEHRTVEHIMFALIGFPLEAYAGVLEKVWIIFSFDEWAFGRERFLLVGPVVARTMAGSVQL